MNSVGELEYMPGKMGKMMKKAGFRMNGRSKIYSSAGSVYISSVKEAVTIDVQLSPQKRKRDIKFYGNDILKGNFIFRKFILEPDTRNGIRNYNNNR